MPLLKNPLSNTIPAGGFKRTDFNRYGAGLDHALCRVALADLPAVGSGRLTCAFEFHHFTRGNVTNTTICCSLPGRDDQLEPALARGLMPTSGRFRSAIQ